MGILFSVLRYLYMVTYLRFFFFKFGGIQHLGHWQEYFFVSDELTDFVYLLISTKKEVEREEGVEATSLLQDKHYHSILKAIFFGGFS